MSTGLRSAWQQRAPSGDLSGALYEAAQSRANENIFTSNLASGLYGYGGSSLLGLSNLAEVGGADNLSRGLRSASNDLLSTASLYGTDHADMGSVTDAGSFWNSVKANAGQGFGSMAPIVTAAPLGLTAGLAAATAPMYGENIGTLEQDASLRGLSAGQKSLYAAPTALAQGALNYLVPGGVVANGARSLATRAGTGAAGKAVGTLGAAMAVEGATEAGEEALRQGMHSVANPQRDTSGDARALVQAGYSGALGGSPIGAAQAVGGYAQDKLGERVPDTRTFEQKVADTVGDMGVPLATASAKREGDRAVAAVDAEIDMLRGFEAEAKARGVPVKQVADEHGYRRKSARDTLTGSTTLNPSMTAEEANATVAAEDAARDEAARVWAEETLLDPNASSLEQDAAREIQARAQAGASTGELGGELVRNAESLGEIGRRLLKQILGPAAPKHRSEPNRKGSAMAVKGKRPPLDDPRQYTRISEIIEASERGSPMRAMSRAEVVELDPVLARFAAGEGTSESRAVLDRMTGSPEASERVLELYREGRSVGGAVVDGDTVDVVEARDTERDVREALDDTGSDANITDNDGGFKSGVQEFSAPEKGFKRVSTGVNGKPYFDAHDPDSLTTMMDMRRDDLEEMGEIDYIRMTTASGKERRDAENKAIQREFSHLIKIPPGTDKEGREQMLMDIPPYSSPEQRKQMLEEINTRWRTLVQDASSDTTERVRPSDLPDIRVATTTKENGKVVNVGSKKTGQIFIEVDGGNDFVTSAAQLIRIISEKNNREQIIAGESAELGGARESEMKVYLGIAQVIEALEEKGVKTTGRVGYRNVPASKVIWLKPSEPVRPARKELSGSLTLPMRTPVNSNEYKFPKDFNIGTRGQTTPLRAAETTDVSTKGARRWSDLDVEDVAGMTQGEIADLGGSKVEKLTNLHFARSKYKKGSARHEKLTRIIEGLEKTIDDLRIEFDSRISLERGRSNAKQSSARTIKFTGTTVRMHTRRDDGNLIGSRKLAEEVVKNLQGGNPTEIKKLLGQWVVLERVQSVRESSESLSETDEMVENNDDSDKPIERDEDGNERRHVPKDTSGMWNEKERAKDFGYVARTRKRALEAERRGNMREAAVLRARIGAGKDPLPGMKSNPPKAPEKYQAKETAKLEKADLILAPISVADGYAGNLARWAQKEGILYTPGAFKDMSGKTLLVSIPGQGRGFNAMDTLINRVKKALDTGAEVLTDNATHATRPHNASGEGVLRQALLDSGYVETSGEMYSSWKKGSQPAKHNAQSAQEPEAKWVDAKEVEAALKEVQRLLGKDFPVEAAKELLGPNGEKWSGEHVPDLIKIAVGAADKVGVARHEALHQIFAWMREHGGKDTIRLIENVAKNATIQRDLKLLLTDHPGAIEQLSDPEEAAAYLFQFWMADQIKIGKQTEKFFKKVLEFLNQAQLYIRDKLFGDAKAGEARTEQERMKLVDAIFGEIANEAFVNAGERARVVEVLENNAKAVENRRANEKLLNGKVQGFLERNIFAAASVFEGSDNPHVKALGQRLFRMEGDKLAEQAFLENYMMHNDKFQIEIRDILLGIDPGMHPEMLRHLNERTDREKINIPEVREAVKKVDALMDKLFVFQSGRGVQRWDSGLKEWVPLQKIRDRYWTRVWSVDYLLAHQNKFMDKMIAALEAEYAKGEFSEIQDKNAREHAKAIFHALVNGRGAEDKSETTTDLGISPYAMSVNQRKLGWIDDKEFAEFYSQDIVETLTNYSTQAIKRAVYTKYFDKDGGRLRDAMFEAMAYEMVGAERMDEVREKLKELRKKWADTTQDEGDERAPTMVHAARRVLGDKADEAQAAAADKLHNVSLAIQAIEGTLGSDINPTLRQAISATTTFQHFRLLPLALFASANDIVGMVNRGGTLNDAYQALVRGVREIKLRWKDQYSQDDLAKMSERMGVVSANSYSGALGDAYSSQYMHGRLRRYNDVLFKYNGLEAWNRAMRIQATGAAVNFIKDHVAKLKADPKNETSKRYIEELFGENYKLDDILNADGEINESREENLAAVLTWVNGAVLRPNASHRPINASDPHYQLFYSLKQFAYTFHKVILRRTWNEMQHGNFGPLTTLFVGYVPVTLAADLVKELLIVGDDDPWWTKNGGVEMLSHAVGRAAIGGVPQMWLGDTVGDPLTMFSDPGRMLGRLSNVAGPAPDQLADLLTVPFFDNKDLSRELWGGLPGGVLWRRYAD